MDKERLIDDILRVYNHYGYINRKILVNNISDYNVDFQLSKYGGLKKICEELDIKYRQFSKIDSELIKADFLRVYNERGKISKDFYKSFKNFYNSVYRDRIKEKLLTKHGIRLIRIDYNEPLTKEYIIDKCSV